MGLGVFMGLRARSAMFNLGLTAVLACLAMAFTFGLGAATWPYTWYSFQGILIAIPPVGIMLGLLAAMNRRARFFNRRKDVALAAFFVVLPYVYSLGTATNFWRMLLLAGVFWVAAGLVMLIESPESKSLEKVGSTFAAATVAVSALLANSGSWQSYRQLLPISKQTEFVEVGGNERSRIGVGPDSAIYIRTLRQAAAAAGFVPGTPVLDMTHEFPGTVFALSGSAPGVPWLVGGYPRSVQYIDAALRLVPCTDLGRAWILTPKSHPTGIFPRLLADRGLDLISDYDEVGRAVIQNLRWVGSPMVEHLLLKPRPGRKRPTVGCVESRD